MPETSNYSDLDQYKTKKQLSKKALFLAVILGFLALLGVFIVFLNQNASNTPQPNQNQDATLREVPTTAGAFSKDDYTWNLVYLQPTVVGYEQSQGANFMLVQFPELNTKNKVFISGTLSELQSDSTALSETNNGQKVIDLRNLDYIKNKFPEGSRIRIAYITAIPPAFNTSFCDEPYNERICMFTNYYLANEDTFNFSDTAFLQDPNVVIPAFYLYDELVTEDD